MGGESQMYLKNHNISRRYLHGCHLQHFSIYLQIWNQFCFIHKGSKTFGLKSAWVTQSVKTESDFGSCHNLMVCELKPLVRLSAELRAWSLLKMESVSLFLSLSVSLSLCPSPTHALSLSLPPK